VGCTKVLDSMRTILLSQDYSCRKLAAVSSCRLSRLAGAEDLIKGGTTHPCDATSRRGLRRHWVGFNEPGRKPKMDLCWKLCLDTERLSFSS